MSSPLRPNLVLDDLKFQGLAFGRLLRLHKLPGHTDGRGLPQKGRLGCLRPSQHTLDVGLRLVVQLKLHWLHPGHLVCGLFVAHRLQVVVVAGMALHMLGVQLRQLVVF
jgi:hypothetical protein